MTLADLGCPSTYVNAFEVSSNCFLCNLVADKIKTR